MKIQTQATHVTLTLEIESYLEKKLSMLDKLVGNRPETMVAVELSRNDNHQKTGNVFRAEFTLFEKGPTLRAVCEANDLYAAIDLAKDELARELKNHKGKKRDLFRKGALKLKNIVKGLSGRGEN